MTDQERIERLEHMVKTLAETVHSLTQVVNTGSYEYSLSDVLSALRHTEEYKSEPVAEEPVEDYSSIAQFLAKYAVDTPKAKRCQGAWHEDKSISMDPWCPVCGRST